jgi:hypothetical protein
VQREVGTVDENGFFGGVGVDVEEERETGLLFGKGLEKVGFWV